MNQMNSKDYKRYLELKKLIKQTRKEIKELKWAVTEMKVTVENNKHNLDPRVMIIMDKYLSRNFEERGYVNGSGINEQQNRFTF